MPKFASHSSATGNHDPVFVKDVVESCLKGDLRCPASDGVQPGWVTAQYRGLNWALQFGVRFEAHGRFSEGHETLGKIANSQIVTGAYVVGLACLALLHEQPVGPNDIANIGDVAAGCEVSNWN
jgi:hypothetical protein